MVNNGVWVTRCQVRKFPPHGFGIMIGRRAGGQDSGVRSQGMLSLQERVGHHKMVATNVLGRNFSLHKFRCLSHVHVIRLQR